MTHARRTPSRHPTQRRSLKALPYYFYVVGVLAAIAAAALLVSAEAQGQTPAALGAADVALATCSEQI